MSFDYHTKFDYIVMVWIFFPWALVSTLALRCSLLFLSVTPHRRWYAIIIMWLMRVLCIYQMFNEDFLYNYNSKYYILINVIYLYILCINIAVIGIYLASFARRNAIMVPRRFVAAHTTRYERFGRCSVRVCCRKVLICKQNVHWVLTGIENRNKIILGT